MASRAAPVQILLAGVRDTSGQPLASGKVYTYTAGTSTPEAIYTDKDKLTPAANPIILDANGQAQVYADGYIKLVVKTSADATLYTWDYLYFGDDYTSATLLDTDGSGHTLVKAASGKATKFQQNGADKWEIESTNCNFIPSANNTRDIGSSSYKVRAGYFDAVDLGSVADSRTEALRLSQFQDGTPIWGGAAGGTANALTVTLSPAVTAITSGMTIRFSTTTTNTGATTLNVNGTGAVNIYNPYYGATSPLRGGEIIAYTLQEVVYYGVWWLINPSSAWQTYSPSVTGLTGATTTARYKLEGNKCIVRIISNGTSNATNFAFSAPIISANIGAGVSWGAPAVVRDNSVDQTSPGYAQLSNNDSTIYVYKNYAFAGWTAANLKLADFTLIYEI